MRRRKCKDANAKEQLTIALLPSHSFAFAYISFSWLITYNLMQVCRMLSNVFALDSVAAIMLTMKVHKYFTKLSDISFNKCWLSLFIMYSI